jgi:hypothetical protein
MGCQYLMLVFFVFSLGETNSIWIDDMVIVTFLDGISINSINKLEPIMFQSLMMQIPYFHIVLPIYKSLDELFD